MYQMEHLIWRAARDCKSTCRIMYTGVCTLQTHQSFRNLHVLVSSLFFGQFFLNFLQCPLWLPVTILSQGCELSRQDQPCSLTTALLCITAKCMAAGLKSAVLTSCVWTRPGSVRRIQVLTCWLRLLGALLTVTVVSGMKWVKQESWIDKVI